MSDVIPVKDQCAEELLALSKEVTDAKFQLAELELQKQALIQGIYLAQQSLTKRASDLAKEMNLDLDNEKWQLDVQNMCFVKNDQ
jgi:hypothetical protein